MRIAGLDHIDAKRISSARMFTNSARAQSHPRIEQVIGRERHHDQRAIDKQVLVEQHRPDQRNIAKHRDFKGAKRCGLVQPAKFSKYLAGHIGCKAQHEQVDHHPGNDLVNAVGDHQHRQQQTEHTAGQHGADDAGPAAHQGSEQGPGKGPGQKHAFNGDIDHGNALAQDAAKRSQRDRHRADNCCLQHASQRNGLASCRPDKKRHR